MTTLESCWNVPAAMITEKETVLARILSDEMQRAGHSEHSLAIEAGLKVDVVRDILRGKSRDPGVSKMYEIGRVLGRTVGQLLGKEPLTDRAATTLKGPGQYVKEPAELTLLAFWRRLSETERVEIMNLILDHVSTSPP